MKSSIRSENSRFLNGSMLLAFLLLFATALSNRHSCAQTPQQKPKEGTTWGINNVTVEFRVGADRKQMEGNCAGMVELNQMYRQLGLDKQRTLKEATTPRPGHEAEDRMFYEQVAAMAQTYVYRNRDVGKDVYAQPTAGVAVEGSLEKSNVSPENPQRLVLSNGGVSHMVSLENHEERPGTNQVVYQVSDPNHPGEVRHITYDKNTKTFEPYEGYATFRHDTSEMPEQNRKWLEAMARMLASPQHYIPYWKDPRDVPLSPDEYRKSLNSSKQSTHIIEPPVPSEGLNKSVSAMNSQEVGGVRLYFDPAIVTDAYNTQRWEMLRTLTEQIADGKTNFLVHSGSEEKLQAVRLSAVLRDAENNDSPTIGGLTRISGYVRSKQDGEIYLLGRVEPGVKPIPLDVLTVALRLIWKDGRKPAISLDPDVRNFSSAQRARLVDISEECRHSKFIRIMLEADYEMKRIMLGDDMLGIPGYQSSYDLIKVNPKARQAEYARWWLYPKEDTGADAYRTVNAALESVYFESDIKVLTESMKQMDSFLIGTGMRDPNEEQASLLFTQYFDKIEATRPIFHELHGLFDAAKLATVLRVCGVKSEIFDAAAARPIAQVAIKESYDGIGPKVIRQEQTARGTLEYFVSGGVEYPAQLRQQDIANDENLISEDAVDILSRGHVDQVDLTLQLPKLLPLDPTRARRVNGNLEAFTARNELTAGKVSEALTRLDRVLDLDSSLTQARAVRALARLLNGDYALALADADRIVPSVPEFQSTRGLIRLYCGDATGALSDVGAAAIAFPEQESVLEQKAFVEVNALQWEAAAKDLKSLLLIDPFNARHELLRADLRLFQSLGKEAARESIRQRMAVPMPVALALFRAGRSNNPDLAIELAEQALGVARANHNPQMKNLYLAERCMLQLVGYHFARGSQSDIIAARSMLARVARLHPQWPSPLLVQVEYDKTLPLKQAVALFEQGARMDASADPLSHEMQSRLGVDLKAYSGFVLFGRGMESIGHKGMDLPTLDALARRVSLYAPAGPVAFLLAYMRKIMPIAALDAQGKKIPPALGMQAVKEFEQFMLTVPQPSAHADATTLKAVSAIYAGFGERFFADDPQHKSPSGKPMAALQDIFFVRFTHAINTDWNTYDTLVQATATNIAVHDEFAGQLVKRMQQRPEFKVLIARSKAGTISPDETQSSIDHIAESVIAALPPLSKFSRSLLRAMMEDLYPPVAEAAGLQLPATIDILRMRRFLEPLGQTPVTPMEQKTGSIWLNQQVLSIPNSITDEAKADLLITTLHAASRRLDLLFASGSR